jgi:ABC-type nickel/cobalt efflux system permease component RcnA
MLRKAALALVASFVLALAIAGTASAHPLGNFTVNRHAAIELAGGSVYVRYSLDLAEIPTFQLGADVRRPSFAGMVARQLELRIDGARVPLRAMRHRIVARDGAGGLETLRFDAVFSAPASGESLSFADRMFAARIGWREITISARDGARLVDASVPSTSRSNELRAYPRDLLSSPLDIRAATARFEPGSGSAPAPGLDPAPIASHPGGGFEALIERGELSVGVVLLSLLIAAFWGAVHALTPGHGKALVAGYLVGTRGRPRHAFALGATVTLTHTAGVFALGLVTLLLSQFVVPEQLYPWLTLASGLLVVAVGLGVLRARLRATRVQGHGHTHGHAHEHSHEHAHAHVHGGGLQSDTIDHPHHDHRDEALTSRGILGVGIAAGLLPCPSALVVLLSAIALHRVGFGMALIVAFSLGLALTITAIGLAAVLARRAFSRVRLDGPVIRALPAISAAVIVVVGLAITAKAVPGVA